MIGPIESFNTIGIDERQAAIDAIAFQLSGYLAGKERGGREVCALEDVWAETFKVKHAIACNSATSGLLAAAFAAGLGPGDQFVCPAMTMSATCAAPMFTGATPLFGDVEPDHFGLREVPRGYRSGGPIKASFITNLFGHPATLTQARKTAEGLGGILIEDNSQSPFAWEGEKFAGTIGHIGVFSLNVHKPLQCGEGGIVVTDDDELAKRMRAFINHGEHVGPHIGLNLRMPEVCAAIALVQLGRGENIIQGRIAQATAILAAIGDIPGLRMPVVRKGCRHVYYTIPFLVDDPPSGRWAFCNALREQGVPIVEGYVPPLYRMPAFSRFARSCPVVEDLHDRRLFYFENCAHDVTLAQAEQIGDAFRKAAEMVL